MNKQVLSIMQWRCLLIVLGMLVLSLDIWASSHWERSAIALRVGTLGISLGTPDRSSFRQIMKIADGSPLLALSAAPGDAIKFDQPEDALRVLSTDEPVGLTLQTAFQSRHELVKPIPDPLIVNQPILAKFGALVTWAQVFITLLLAMLIGWSRADSTAMRVFALVLLNNSPFSLWNILPSGPLPNLLVDFRLVNLWVVYVGFAYFSMIYPEELGHQWGKWTRRTLLGLAVMFGLVATARTAAFFDALPWALQSRLDLEFLKQSVAIVSVVLSLGMLWHAWRLSAGTARQKLAWAGVCTGMIYMGYLLFNVNLGLGEPIPIMIFESGQYLTILVAYCALTYAMLRHRLFDFGFVVNRVLVVTIVSGFLLVIFGVTEWGVDKLLHFEGREKNIIFDAIVALGIILCFHRIQHWISHQVDHLFFHHWYAAAEKLRQFVDKAPLITDATVLQSKFIRASEEFSGADGMAFYARGANAQFVLQQSTLPGAPPTIDENHEFAIDLAHTRCAVELDQGRHALSGAWGFPIMGRGQLQGLFLAQARMSGQHYRPDQITLLSTAVHQIGLDLESLRSKEFEFQVEALAHQAVELKQQLKHAEQLAVVQEREARALRQLVESAA
ncbi:MAG: hypothetical protein V4463_13455 [Pseudomonadota bacterium]